MSGLSYDEVTAWLRENHRAQVVPAYSDSSSWSCSCGAGDHMHTMPTRIAKTSATRHLRAQREAYLRAQR